MLSIDPQVQGGVFVASAVLVAVAIELVFTWWGSRPQRHRSTTT